MLSLPRVTSGHVRHDHIPKLICVYLRNPVVMDLELFLGGETSQLPSGLFSMHFNSNLAIKVNAE